jgi:hypothetical protein
MPKVKKKYIFDVEVPDTSCSGKNRYTSQAEAESRAEHRTSGRLKISTYKCDLCNGWHLTSWST